MGKCRGGLRGLRVRPRTILRMAAAMAKMEGRKWNAQTGHLCNRCWQEATLPVRVHASTHVFTDKVSFFGGGMGMGA